MKYLVEESSGELRSGFQFPLKSSISGHFVMDVPDFLGVAPASTSVSALTAAKVAAFKALHPSLAHEAHDELLDASLIDGTVSTYAQYGTGKRCAVYPGGKLMTTLIDFTTAPSFVFLHYSTFTLHRDAPDAQGTGYFQAARTLYGWDPQNSVYDQSPPLVPSFAQSDGTVVASLTNDSTSAYGLTDTSIRLCFQNSDYSNPRTVYLSDWLLLWG